MLIFTQQVPKIHGANPNTHSNVNSWVINYFHFDWVQDTFKWNVFKFANDIWNEVWWRNWFALWTDSKFVEKGHILVGSVPVRDMDTFWGVYVEKRIGWTYAGVEDNEWQARTLQNEKFSPKILWTHKRRVLQNLCKQELEPCQAEWFLLCIALWWEYNLLVLIWTFIYVPHTVKKEIIL